MINKKIFISHSSFNQDFANILLNFLQYMGVNKDCIFYSSYYETGVSNKIFLDVFSALKSSVIDIVVLSTEYKKSEYCLNEAGIIAFKDGKSHKFTVVLPGILGKQCAGFLTETSKQYRLLSEDFINDFCNHIDKCLQEENIISKNDVQKQLAINYFKQAFEEYKLKLPIIQNLNILSTSNTLENEQREILDAQESIYKMFCGDLLEKHQMPKVFYKNYARNVLIKAATSPEKIIVETTTTCVLVNLSNDDYFESHRIQFLKTDCHNTFETVWLKINGKNIKKKLPTKEIRNQIINPNYVMYDGVNIKIPPHTSTRIEYMGRYETNFDKFFQSKIIRIPCGNYSMQANFDYTFFDIFGMNYQFRYQVIPPDPLDLDKGIVPSTAQAESYHKLSIHYKHEKGFPAGGGYVLTISEK